MLKMTRGLAGLTRPTRAQDAKDAMPELSNRPKLPPPLVTPPAPSLLPSLRAATAAAVVGGGAAGEGRSLVEGDAASGSAVLPALVRSAGSATAVQVTIAGITVGHRTDHCLHLAQFHP